MSLHSQLITADLPDLARVEALNKEAFPPEERVSLSEMLEAAQGDSANFFAFYDEGDFVGFAFSLYNEACFYLSFFAIMPTKRSQGYGSQIIDKLVEFYQGKTMVLEVERLDEPSDNLSQRQARMAFYQRNGFKSSNAFLNYDGLSFEILYRGDHFDEAAYRDIFAKLQAQHPFHFGISYRDLSDS
ncbi:GNAT family N-acetyltransferase [Streptococcus sp. DD12]|uniref:GNAT family N-acetyltransferase n=1 Tax=Streptococcus sp. DD12 TaxID=1777880 RepID=UPI0007954844|nr:GNAT family N-acetyltransferase [Streptococcus sp. DD12]KXT76293.1 hypothetical protein STRDD12_00630 [Streptococcus sp. DD12]